jgi:hypothetical protein
MAFFYIWLPVFCSLRKGRKMVKSLLLIISSMTLIFSAVPEKKNSLIGTWCANDNGLILTFSGKDSLSVESVSDSSIKGNGTYSKTDSTFIATINNNEIVMKMQYRYHWKGKDSIEAQAIQFSVNGELVDSPKEWATMKRCSKGSKINTKDTKKTTNNTKTAK